MVADIKSRELQKKKNEILDTVIQEMKDWDGEIESGIDLINENQSRLEEIKKINDMILSRNESIENEDYYKKINIVVRELRKMTERLSEAKKELLKERRILSKKDDLVDSYITNKKESVFIDKDVF